MKLDVPFHTQENDYDCGPVSLKMVLDFLGKNYTINELKYVLNYSQGEAVYTIELASAASELGLKSEFFTAEPWNSHEDEEFMEKHGRDEQNQELYDEAEGKDVNIHFKQVRLEELLNLVSKNSIPIVLLDWHEITGEDNYQGHLVPLVGYNQDDVFIHEPSDPNGDFIQIPRDEFDKARKAEGTDQDISLIKLNQNR